MSLQIAPLQKEKHAQTKINTAKAFTFAQEQHILPVVVQEFVRIGAEMPIVFIKDPASERFDVVAMLGLKTGENLMVTEGRWQGFYVPRVLWNHPLILADDPSKEGQLVVALVESSHMVNTETGHALFNEDGTESDFLKSRVESMREFFMQSQSTRAFNKVLADMDLLIPQTLTITREGQPREISGIYIVDEKKLNSLSDEQLLDLNKRGLMPAIYAHLMSLQQVQRLGERAGKAATTAA
ncbi:SapC family protein [Rheinheimera sp. 1928-s]|uniref:SapC family protein n=1 Tax=Rheinheimera sp. 1928-s TaxID=3033803 RepID=UPI002609C280|nr:SapC family protein [Rheinheimera sp. 1928-s]MDF3123704.1 SapC family protein [Rheinheimera sp. 1928-s]